MLVIIGHRLWIIMDDDKCWIMIGRGSWIIMDHDGYGYGSWIIMDNDGCGSLYGMVHGLELIMMDVGHDRT